jgi:microcystin-dependent protein
LQFKSTVIGNAGGGQPFNNMQPYLTMRFCVSLSGLFPPRN